MAFDWTGFLRPTQAKTIALAVISLVLSYMTLAYQDYFLQLTFLIIFSDALYFGNFAYLKVNATGGVFNSAKSSAIAAITPALALALFWVVLGIGPGRTGWFGIVVAPIAFVLYLLIAFLSSLIGEYIAVKKDPERPIMSPRLVLILSLLLTLLLFTLFIPFIEYCVTRCDPASYRHFKTTIPGWNVKSSESEFTGFDLPLLILGIIISWIVASSLVYILSMLTCKSKKK
ncbi:MAG: hypothetical protein NTX79_06560 [Candidatus Micrarchaeota archaeon]|nr:hypothetical protein [Candidatus Micrarchaeota archaeon]